MKKLIFAALLLTISLTTIDKLQAQVSVNINLGNQPAWAPEGYDNTEYYYIPDADIYYDVPAHQFLYLSNGRWVRVKTLPANYRKYDLYTIYKVPINEKNAYLKHNVHIKEYASFKGKNGQTPIRDSKEDKYVNNKGNWKNNSFNNGNGNNNGKGNGNNKNSKGGKH